MSSEDFAGSHASFSPSVSGPEDHAAYAAVSPSAFHEATGDVPMLGASPAHANGANGVGRPGSKDPSSFSFVSITFILCVVGCALQINGAAGQAYITLSSNAFRFGALFFLWTWGMSLIALSSKGVHLLCLSAGMLCSLAMSVMPFEYLDELRQTSSTVSDNKKVLIGCILAYIGAGGMFVMTVRFLESLPSRPRRKPQFTSTFASSLAWGTLLLNVIGTSCLLSNGSNHIPIISIPLPISFVFFTGVVFHSPPLVSCAALLSSFAMLSFLQFVIDASDTMSPSTAVMTGYVTLWLASLSIVGYYCTVVASDDRQPVANASSDSDHLLSPAQNHTDFNEPPAYPAPQLRYSDSPSYPTQQYAATQPSPYSTQAFAAYGHSPHPRYPQTYHGTQQGPLYGSYPGPVLGHAALQVHPSPYVMPTTGPAGSPEGPLYSG